MSDQLKFALMLFAVGTFALFSILWQSGKRKIAGAIAIVAVIVVVLLAFQAEAHDHSRPELNKWFDSLRSGKGPCCSDADGYALSDVDWESKDGHYRVRIEGAWYDVPEDAVITEPNRAGRTMVWPIYNRGLGGFLSITIRCFMPGPMG